MHTKLIKRLITPLLLTGLVLGSSLALAEDDGSNGTGIIPTCKYLPLVPDMLYKVTNTTVCVDIPVNLIKAKVVFNMDMNAVDAKGRPIGMNHMFMLATGLKARMAKGLIKPHAISIIGLFHGSAASWVLSDDWWRTNKNTEGNPYGGWIEKLVALKNEGINIQLEECGATMAGNGWSNSDLFTSDKVPMGTIHVNQGAIARAIALQQQDYAVIHPGK